MNAPDAAGGDWLTVSQAAAALAVSERTIRRRCEKKKLRARLVTTDSGAAWLIDPADVPDVAAVIAADTAANAADTRDEPGITLSPGRGRGEMIEQLRGEVEFLRARNAELNAVVMQQARALSSLGSARELESVPEPIGKPGDARETPERTESPARPPERRESRFPAKARPLWQVILGIRPKE